MNLYRDSISPATALNLAPARSASSAKTTARSCDGLSRYRKMADRTRPIVRLAVTDGMVTKGYQKGVYDWVTKGIWRCPSPFPAGRTCCECPSRTACCRSEQLRQS